jgi:hypothetical protein
MDMEQWWNDTGRGKPKNLEKNLNDERAWTSGSWLQYSSEDSLFLHPNCLLPSRRLHTQQILKVGITLQQFVKNLLPRHYESLKWHLRL